MIFDLDGVIVDTAKYHYLAWKKMAAQFGYDFTEEENEAFKGVSRARCMELLLEMAQIEASEEQINEWLSQKNQDYLAYIEQMDQQEILPGVLTALSFVGWIVPDLRRLLNPGRNNRQDFWVETCRVG